MGATQQLLTAAFLVGIGARGGDGATLANDAGGCERHPVMRMRLSPFLHMEFGIMEHRLAGHSLCCCGFATVCTQGHTVQMTRCSHCKSQYLRWNLVAAAPHDLLTEHTSPHVLLMVFRNHGASSACKQLLPTAARLSIHTASLRCTAAFAWSDRTIHMCGSHCSAA